MLLVQRNVCNSFGTSLMIYASRSGSAAVAVV